MKYSNNIWRQIEFGYYSAHDVGNPAYYVYEDEIYFDVTQSRVELGNANTWAGCTRRELQIPTQWSTTSVTVTVNRGQFTNTDIVYLYIVDSTGVSNSPWFVVAPVVAPTPAAPGKIFSLSRRGI